MMNIPEKLTHAESSYLSAILKNGKMPDLEGMWELMDAAWEECQCDQNVMDERIERFYRHPVWLLNGLFIEQHAESINHRKDFTEYVRDLNPARVADFGGGYGTLARMIGVASPDAEVHIVEPHPFETAVFLAEQTPNVRYVPWFQGEYDVLIATDVFEHVPDPLLLVEQTAKHLKEDGLYLIANCFHPVIRCHLPSTFHFRYSWEAAMMAMGLWPGEPVSYGRAYIKKGVVTAQSACHIEQRSRKIFHFLEKIPGRVRDPFVRLIFGVNK